MGSPNGSDGNTVGRGGALHGDGWPRPVWARGTPN